MEMTWAKRCPMCVTTVRNQDQCGLEIELQAVNSKFVAIPLERVQDDESKM